MGEDRTATCVEKKSNGVVESAAASTRHRNPSSVISSSCSDDAESTGGCRDDDDRDMELEYGPGIVHKLRTRFLSISMKQGHGGLRRACSMENLLEQARPEEGRKQQIFAANGTATASSKGQLGYLKRAKSMDTLLLDLEAEAHRQQEAAGGGIKCVRRPDLGRTLPTICDEELPKPDTVKTYKRMFEPAESRRGSHCRRPPVLRASAKSGSGANKAAVMMSANKTNGTSIVSAKVCSAVAAKSKFSAKQSPLTLKAQPPSLAVVSGDSPKPLNVKPLVNGYHAAKPFVNGDSQVKPILNGSISETPKDNKTKLIMNGDAQEKPLQNGDCQEKPMCNGKPDTNCVDGKSPKRFDSNLINQKSLKSIDHTFLNQKSIKINDLLNQKSVEKELKSVKNNISTTEVYYAQVKDIVNKCNTVNKEPLKLTKKDEIVNQYKSRVITNHIEAPSYKPKVPPNRPTLSRNHKPNLKIVDLKKPVTSDKKSPPPAIQKPKLDKPIEIPSSELANGQDVNASGAKKYETPQILDENNRKNSEIIKTHKTNFEIAKANNSELAKIDNINSEITKTNNHVKPEIEKKISSLPAIKTSPEVPAIKVEVSQEKKMEQNALQEQKPEVAYNIKPDAKGTKPVAEDTKLVAKYIKPAAKDIKPVTKDIKPVAKDFKPVAKDITPVTKDTKPVAKDTKPVAKDTQPVAKDTKPVAKDTQPIAKDATPVAKDTQPVAKDATPVAKDTKTVVDDSKPSSPEVKNDKDKPAFSPKKTQGGPGSGAAAPSSMVFDFRGKDVVPQVAVLPVPFGCKSLHPKKRPLLIDGKEATAGAYTNGVGGAEDEGDEEYVDYSVPAPCGVVFEGENVKVGRGSILATRNKDLKIKFDDEVDKNTFVYPSEVSLLDDPEGRCASPAAPDKEAAAPMTNGQSPPTSKLKCNTSIGSSGSGGLSSYTPSVLRTMDNFQPGAFRAAPAAEEAKGQQGAAPEGEEENTEVVRGEEQQEGMLKPADPHLISSWSLSAGTSDLLF